MKEPLRSRGVVSEPRPVREVVKAMRRQIGRFDEDRQNLFRENGRLRAERDAALTRLAELEEGLRNVAMAAHDLLDVMHEFEDEPRLWGEQMASLSTSAGRARALLPPKEPSE